MCGIKPQIPNSVRCDSEKTNRIVGGGPAQAYSWPWLVHFDRIGCAGSILTERWVVTGKYDTNYYTTKILKSGES